MAFADVPVFATGFGKLPVLFFRNSDRTCFAILFRKNIQGMILPDAFI